MATSGTPELIVPGHRCFEAAPPEALVLGPIRQLLSDLEQASHPLVHARGEAALEMWMDDHYIYFETQLPQPSAGCDVDISIVDGRLMIRKAR